MYAWLFVARCLCSQTVSPMIQEFIGEAEGRIALTNNTPEPVAVVLEPRSFNIAPDGHGVYRSLDSKVHLKLSSTSFRIDPGQTLYALYRAKADTLPAWFTIYSTFSMVGHRTGLDTRILLPHTVYIYPKKRASKGDIIEAKQAAYFWKMGKIVCEIENNTLDLERVEKVRVTSDSMSVTYPGFPLLPGAKRHLQMDWKETDSPEELEIFTTRSTLKLKLTERE